MEPYVKLKLHLKIIIRTVKNVEAVVEIVSMETDTFQNLSQKT